MWIGLIRDVDRIIIPTVYRDDYLGVLRKLSRKGETDPYIRMLLHAADFSETVLGENTKEMQKHLENCNAFLEPTEGMLIFQSNGSNSRR